MMNFIYGLAVGVVLVVLVYPNRVAIWTAIKKVFAKKPPATPAP
jgi:hypothetical protein